MRLELKARVDRCAMPDCLSYPDDASGTWYIIKELSIYFPLGWVPWAWFQDIGMFSVTRSHIICREHGAHGPHTIHVIDGN